MAKPEILSKRALSVAYVKDVLKKVQQRDEELTFRGGKAQEYVNEVSALSLTKSKELLKKLMALDLPRVKEEHYIKIIDTMPESADQLKVILSGFNLTLTKDRFQQIIDVLDEYRPVAK